ncbi:unnamed protein product [Rotaria sp. Silwood2]|nr:unnamed protein product [Rotaria sp. Silwood2]CAF3254406.1 unnamed protein product [Rotaria sp. Silwood2]CAF3423542.1 unnamed protein product [Rotaria sp. Silwood2]CAF3545532.1 unnamed protein product [Rotaria sp. Silwood2]CAF4638065.1 unnamed protein product [Rotaria sp. Silwood2]
MATSNRCSVCQKRAGTCICPGCQAFFCDDDFQSHRGSLLNELDGLTVDRNELQAKINEATSKKISVNHIVAQVDEWQRKTIEKVKETAELARQQISKIMNSKLEKIMGEFETLSQELKELRETKGVVEQNLERLKEKIRRLNEDLEQAAQSPSIELNTKQSDQIIWQHMIYVKEKSVNLFNRWRQTKSIGEHQEKIAMLN